MTDDTPQTTERAPCPACGALPCDHVIHPPFDWPGLVADALDLCVRAKRLDAIPATGSATPALWAQEQYDRDLAAWEARARSAINDI